MVCFGCGCRNCDVLPCNCCHLRGIVAVVIGLFCQVEFADVVLLNKTDLLLESGEDGAGEREVAAVRIRCVVMRWTKQAISHASRGIWI